jgi:hypothetical protein
MMGTKSNGGRIGARLCYMRFLATVESDRARQLSGPVSSVSSLLGNDGHVYFDGGDPMRTIRQLLVFPLVLVTAMAAPAFADPSRQSAEGATADVQHLVPPAQLTATVTDRVAAQDASRAAIREALARPEVQDVAASMHLDLSRASAAIETLTGTDLEQAANAARTVNQQMVGGASTIVISTTTIIIILLLVIILIIAIK